MDDEVVEKYSLFLEQIYKLYSFRKEYDLCYFLVFGL